MKKLILLPFLVVLSVGNVAQANIDIGNEYKVTPPIDQFGPVAVDGDRVVAGSESTNEVFVYVRSGSGWVEEQKLTEPGTINFGASVDIEGDLIIVGDTALFSMADQAAYVFKRTGGVWSKIQKLTPSTPAIMFAQDVAISQNTAFVGTRENVAYVFTGPTPPGVAWPEQILSSPAAMFVSFGGTVHVDQDLAIVGDALLGGGAAYVFRKAPMTGLWMFQQELTTLDALGSAQYGRSVVIQKADPTDLEAFDTAVVSAHNQSNGGIFQSGAAYVFAFDGATWTQQEKLVADDPSEQDRFGHTVALSGDLVVVGAYLDSDPVFAQRGSAYLFERFGDGSWSLPKKFEATDGDQLDTFGYFVAISDCTVLIGAPNHEVDLLVEFKYLGTGNIYSYLVDSPEHCFCSAPPPPNNKWETAQMVSWWQLNELEVDGLSKDNAGNNDGSWETISTTLPTPIFGMVHNGLSFDTRNYVKVPHDVSLDFQDRDFSIDAWVTPLSHSGSDPILGSPLIDKTDSNGVGYGLWWTNDSKLAVLLGDGPAPAVAYVSLAEVPINIWTLVAVTIDRVADKGRVYINGLLEDTFVPSATGTSINNTGPLFMAFSQASGQATFHGALDEVEIFGRVMTPTEVKVIYEALSGGKCPPCTDPPPDIVGWWKFDGTPDDLTGTNPGELKNGPVFVQGMVQKAVHLNGVDQYVKIPDDGLVSGTGNFSIDAWIKPNQVDNLVQFIASKKDANTGVGWTLSLRSGHLIFDMDDGLNSTLTYVSPNRIPALDWTLVGVSVDRSQLNMGKVYINGQLDPNAGTFNAQPIGNIKNTRALTIGTGEIVDFFNGLIDEFEVIESALTQGDFNAIYLARTAGKCARIFSLDANRDGLADTTAQLIVEVQAVSLGGGISNALTSKLQNAQDSYDNGDIISGNNKMNAFANHVRAQQSKKITNPDAELFLKMAENIVSQHQSTAAGRSGNSTRGQGDIGLGAAPDDDGNAASGCSVGAGSCPGWTMLWVMVILSLRRRRRRIAEAS